ncbi:MAG: hypothetical protein JNJ89_03400 [Rubrivivax sp.]|nr:hypothetical protein [Rubrivivax sp.]
MKQLKNCRKDSTLSAPWTRRQTLRALGQLAGPWVAVGPPAWAAADAQHHTDRAPLLYGMGGYQVPDASASALARRLVAQGMVLAWSFNGAEAARSFTGALEADPGCAAAAWGQAWSLGPTVNTDLADADAPRVHAALERARVLRASAPPRWHDLIDALRLRHPVAGSAAVDEEAYEKRLAALLHRYPRDADIATLAAEALMNLHPYDWWQGPARRPRPWTPAIERRLRHALALHPPHPGANHAWVHLMESSATPGRARREADRLRTLVPGSGHLLHMPAHIDMRLGRYAAATQANEAAVAADRRYLEQVDAQGAYRVGYVAHNHHFLWASASMQGRGALAIDAADEAFTAACGPQGVPRGAPVAGTLQHLQALPALARVRFGRWKQVTAGVPPPEGDAAYALALWHYARGTAFVRLGDAGSARREGDALTRIAATPALAALRIKGVHAAGTLLEIAQLTLQADLALAAGTPAQALAPLARAVALEDGLAPDEPHLWLAPTRQALGAALLRASRPAEAARAFAQDLQHYPDNGWSLLGLMRAQRALHQRAAAAQTAARLAAAWREADVTLATPRL